MENNNEGDARRGPYNRWCTNPNLEVPKSTKQRDAVTAELWEHGDTMELSGCSTDGDGSEEENDAYNDVHMGSSELESDVAVPADSDDSDGSDASSDSSDASSDSSDASSDSSDASSDDQENEEEDDLYLLKQLLQQPLHPHTDEILLNFVYDITLLFSKHKKKSLIDDILMLFKKYLPRNASFPNTRYKLLKMINIISPQNGKHVKHSVCSNPKCHKYYGTEDTPQECHVCLGKDFMFFVENKVEKTLRHFLEKTDLANLLEESALQHRTENNICDIQDGLAYKDLNINTMFNISFTFNTDGFPAGCSTINQVWPQYCRINEIKASRREDFTVLAGVWFSPNKPTMNTFLLPFTEEMVKLGTEGFTWHHPTRNEQITTTVLVPIFSVDASARAPILNMVQWNGGEGCGSCFEPGERIQVGRGTAQVYPMRENLQLRTHDQMLQHAEEATPDTPCHGMKGVPVVALLPKIDLARSFPPEYQHCVLLGVVRRLLSISIQASNKNSGFFIGNKLPTIEKKLLAVKPTSYITRTPRGFKNIRDWKSSEYRHWLLYYSLFCLQDVLPDVYFQHWILLVAGIYTLLKKKVSVEEIDVAKDALLLFCSEIEQLYSKSEMTFNMHSILHLSDSVKNWGQLFHWSTFPFENENGVMKNMIYGSKNVGVEISNSIDIISSLHCLKSLMIEQELPNRNFLMLGAPIDKIKIDEIIITHIEQYNASDFKIFFRAKSNGLKYASKYYTRQEVRDNTIIQYSNNKYGVILCFVKYENGEVLCIIEDVTKGKNIFTHKAANLEIEHICEYTVTGTMSAVEVHLINFTLIKLTEGIFCIPPNLIEINL